MPAAQYAYRRVRCPPAAACCPPATRPAHQVRDLDRPTGAAHRCAATSARPLFAPGCAHRWADACAFVRPRTPQATHRPLRSGREPHPARIIPGLAPSVFAVLWCCYLSVGAGAEGEQHGGTSNRRHTAAAAAAEADACACAVRWRWVCREGVERAGCVRESDDDVEGSAVREIYVSIGSGECMLRFYRKR